jgi:hypothetical protein
MSLSEFFDAFTNFGIGFIGHLLPPS